MCPVLHKLQIGFGVIEVTARCKVQGPSFVQQTIVMSMLVQQYNKSWTAEHKTFERKTKRFMFVLVLLIEIGPLYNIYGVFLFSSKSFDFLKKL